LRNRHFVTSFSYPAKLIDTMDKAEALAKQDSKTLSALIVDLLIKYVEKNAERVAPERNPLGILYQESKIKTLDVFFTALTGLDEWLERDTMLSSEDASKIEGRAIVLQRKAKQRYIELRHKERFGPR
jgi:hypothetical protein